MKNLWAHQKDAVEFSRLHDSVALFMETGTGKSRTAIEIVNDKSKRAGRILKVLILTPQVVTFNWKKEFSQFSNLPDKQIIVLHGTAHQRVRQLTHTPNYFVVICNYESLLMSSVYEELRKWMPDVVVADESHRIKNPRAQRTRLAVQLAANAQHKLILSGTPITQNQADLFAQFLFLDNGATFGKNFFFFRNVYFTDQNLLLRKQNKMVTWPKWVPKNYKAQELNDKVMRLAVSVKKEDCLDLPPLIRQGIEVSMSTEQAKAYKQMKDDYITFINSKSFTAQLAVTKAMRLQQIASGFIMGEDDKFHSFKNTPREKALLDLLEDLIEDQKVIVWASWKANQAMIHELLTKAKIEHRMLIGDQSAVERERAMNDFREKDEVRVIVGSQAAGGIGVNLIEASASVYYSRSFNLEHDVQSEARNYRGGSERHKSITRYDIFVPGTIDEDITAKLASKMEIAQSILGGTLKV